MTPTQFQRALKRHGLTASDFARVFPKADGQTPTNRRTVQRWHAGESPIPQRVADWFALKECRDRLEKVTERNDR